MMKNEDMSDDRPTVKANEFQKMLQICPNTFKQLLRDGKIPAPLPLGTRTRRWSKTVVLNFLNNL
jgi:hypothetical protein